MTYGQLVDFSLIVSFNDSEFRDWLQTREHSAVTPHHGLLQPTIQGGDQQGGGHIQE